MPQMPKSTVAAAEGGNPIYRKCPGCGVSFPFGGRGLGKVFCTNDCRVKFRNRAVGEGSVLAPLVKAWTQTRHAKAGTYEAEVCAYARREITAIASAFNDADDERGADAVAYVGALMDSGTMWCDRTRK